MPGIDGWGVLRALKKDPATAHIPVWWSRSSTNVPVARPWARRATWSSRSAATTCWARSARSGYRSRRATSRRRGGAMTCPHPRRRGQPEEPEAGARRAGVLWLRRDRGDSGEDGVRLAAGAAAPDPHGPPAARHRRHRGAAPDPRSARWPGRPVVAVTAFAMDEDRTRAFAAGFDGYIEKPISMRGLPDRCVTSSTGERP